MQEIGGKSDCCRSSGLLNCSIAHKSINPPNCKVQWVTTGNKRPATTGDSCAYILLPSPVTNMTQALPSPSPTVATAMYPTAHQSQPNLQPHIYVRMHFANQHFLLHGVTNVCQWQIAVCCFGLWTGPRYCTVNVSGLALVMSSVFLQKVSSCDDRDSLESQQCA